MCVVSLEEVNITPGNVPYELCREIRTDQDGIRQKLDYVIVPASAAIIGAVVVSVIVFIVCLKSSQRKRKGKVSLFIHTGAKINCLSRNYYQEFDV